MQIQLVHYISFIIIYKLFNILSGILAPIIVAAIIGENPTPKEWHYVFMIPSILYVISGISFAIFAKVEPQKNLN